MTSANPPPAAAQAPAVIAPPPRDAWLLTVPTSADVIAIDDGTRFEVNSTATLPDGVAFAPRLHPDRFNEPRAITTSDHGRILATMVPSTTRAIMLRRLAADGTPRWEQPLHSGAIYISAMALLPDGNLLVTGEFYHSMVLGRSTLSTGYRGGFVALLDGESGAVHSLTRPRGCDGVGIPAILPDGGFIASLSRYKRPQLVARFDTAGKLVSSWALADGTGVLRLRLVDGHLETVTSTTTAPDTYALSLERRTLDGTILDQRLLSADCDAASVRFAGDVVHVLCTMLTRRAPPCEPLVWDDRAATGTAHPTTLCSFFADGSAARRELWPSGSPMLWGQPDGSAVVYVDYLSEGALYRFPADARAQPPIYAPDVEATKAFMRRTGMCPDHLSAWPAFSGEYRLRCMLGDTTIAGELPLPKPLVCAAPLTAHRFSGIDSECRNPRGEVVRSQTLDELGRVVVVSFEPEGKRTVASDATGLVRLEMLDVAGTITVVRETDQDGRVTRAGEVTYLPDGQTRRKEGDAYVTRFADGSPSRSCPFGAEACTLYITPGRVAQRCELIGKTPTCSQFAFDGTELGVMRKQGARWVRVRGAPLLPSDETPTRGG